MKNLEDAINEIYQACIGRRGEVSLDGRARLHHLLARKLRELPQPRLEDARVETIKGLRIAIHPTTRALLHYEKAGTLIDLGRYQEAKKVAQQTLKIYGKNTEETLWLYYYLTKAHRKLNDQEAAETSVREGMAIETPFFPIRDFLKATLIEILLDREKYTKVIVESKKNLPLMNGVDDKARVHQLMGFAYSHLGMHKEAITTFAEGLALKPQDPFMISQLEAAAVECILKIPPHYYLPSSRNSTARSSDQ